MPKFFVKASDINQGHIRITGDDVGHIKKVLRLRTGDEILLCDGNGTDYYTRIDEFTPDSVIAVINEVRRNNAEPPVEIVLYQGTPKSDKMDYIIQKCIELGVLRIVPVLTERTVVRIESRKDADSKVARWQRIALEAAKQCNRGVIPEVGYPVSFVDAVKLSQDACLRIIPYEKESGSGLKKYLSRKGIKKAAIFIGPEGGFSEGEIQTAVESGVEPVTLGPRILRTETAGVAALSIMMYELGDIG